MPLVLDCAEPSFLFAYDAQALGAGGAIAVLRGRSREGSKMLAPLNVGDRVTTCREIPDSIFGTKFAAEWATVVMADQAGGVYVYELTDGTRQAVRDRAPTIDEPQEGTA